MQNEGNVFVYKQHYICFEVEFDEHDRKRTCSNLIGHAWQFECSNLCKSRAEAIIMCAMYQQSVPGQGDPLVSWWFLVACKYIIGSVGGR